MNLWQRLTRSVRSTISDERFLSGLKKVEKFVAKILSIAMIVVILTAIVELCVCLLQEILVNTKIVDPDNFLVTTLSSILGSILNILIALEVLENIVVYLRNYVVQLELVIVTSLTAVARKIIIFDFDRTGELELAALAIAIFTLSISYWLLRRTHKRYI